MRHAGLQGDVDDVVQDVMMFLVIRELPGFQRRCNGSFRCWLREVTMRRLQAFCRHRARRDPGPWRSPRRIATARPEPTVQRVEPARSIRNTTATALRRLLTLIEPQFEDRSLTAFRRLVFDGVSPVSGG